MKPKKLYVRNTEMQAKKAKKALDLGEEWKAASPETPLSGYRFLKIVVDVSTIGFSKMEQRRFSDWYDILPTRLLKNGEIINL